MIAFRQYEHVMIVWRAVPNSGGGGGARRPSASGPGSGNPGPASAFHAELLERLTRQTKIDDGALLCGSGRARA